MSEPLLSALAETPWLAVQGSALLLLLTLPAAPRDALTLVRPVALALLLAGLGGRALASLGLGAQPSAAVGLPLLAGLAGALALKLSKPLDAAAPLRPLIVLSRRSCSGPSPAPRPPQPLERCSPYPCSSAQAYRRFPRSLPALRATQRPRSPLAFGRWRSSPSPSRG